jgi:hypothetical protein
MHVVVLLIVLAVIAFLLYKSVQDAKERAAGGWREPTAMLRVPSPGVPPPGPRPRGRPRKPQIDEEALAEHVAKLREAIRTDLISLDEAVASVIRQTEGASARRPLASCCGRRRAGEPASRASVHHRALPG